MSALGQRLGRAMLVGLAVGFLAAALLLLAFAARVEVPDCDRVEGRADECFFELENARAAQRLELWGAAGLALVAAGAGLLARRELRGARPD